MNSQNVLALHLSDKDVKSHAKRIRVVLGEKGIKKVYGDKYAMNADDEFSMTGCLFSWMKEKARNWLKQRGS